MTSTFRRWINKALAAIPLAATTSAQPRGGRIVMPRAEDTMRDYPATGLTPRKLVAILRDADAGDLQAIMQLFEEMEEKDAHLYAVAATRRLALTGLPWEIVNAAELDSSIDRNIAEQTADHARQRLASIEGLQESLEHLSLAVGRNIAVAEIIWENRNGFVPAHVVPVDFGRITVDETDRIRIITREHPDEGIIPPPMKFMIHTPHARSGHPQRGGLLRATAMAFLAKSFALKDWMIFAEIFGMPVRIARYQPSATEEEKRELITMLESLGTNAAGIFSHAIDLQIVEANRGTTGPPYPPLVEFLNREISKAWLGQTLTTDTFGQRGSFAAGRVHEIVRQDILADDMRREALTVRRDLLAPITRLTFGPDAPVPLFRRITRKPLDLKSVAEIADMARNRLGMSVPRKWLYETLQIPLPQEGEDVLAPDDTRPKPKADNADHPQADATIESATNGAIGLTSRTTERPARSYDV